MKVAICTTCSLPIPAVLGGAVESLVELLVEENENIEHNLQLTVFTVKNVKNENFETKSTNFIEYKNNYLVKNIDLRITEVIRTLRRNPSLNNKNIFWKCLVLKKIKKNLIENDYDVVIFENSLFLMLALENERIFKKYSGKCFVHLHNKIEINSKNRKRLRNATKILVVSNFLKKEITKDFPELSDKIYVLRNATDNSFYRQLSAKEKRELRNKHNISTTDKILLFVGRLVPEKGILQLIEAMERLNDDHIKLLIVGKSYFGAKSKTPFEEKLIKQTIDKKKQMIFTGYVDRKKVWKYFQIADLAVLPSTWDEPLGLTIMEAVASALPIISTYKGGIPETLDNKLSIMLKVDDDLSKNIAEAINIMLSDIDIWNTRAMELKKKSISSNSSKRFFDDFSKLIKE